MKNKKTKVNFKRGGAIAITGMMLSTGLGNSIVANAATMHHKKKEENFASDGVNQSGPVTLTLQAPTANVTNNYGQSQSVQYTIPFQFVGNTGKIMNITDVKITPLVKIGYTSKLEDGVAKTSAEAWVASNNSTNGYYYFNSTTAIGTENLNSTSTGQFKLIGSLSGVDHDTALNGELEVTYKVNGKSYSQIVEAPQANLEISKQNYSGSVNYNIIQNKPGEEPTISLNAGLLDVNTSMGGENSEPYYQASLDKIKDMIVKINVGKYGLTINPLYAKYITSLGNNEYKISPLIFLEDSAGTNVINNAFTVNMGTIGKVTNVSVSANEVSTTLSSPVWGSLSVYAKGSSLLVKPSQGKYAIEDTSSLVQNQNGNNIYSPYFVATGNSKFVNMDMSGYDIKNVGHVYGGYIPVSVNGSIQINPKLHYAVMADPLPASNIDLDLSDSEGYQTPQSLGLSFNKDKVNIKFLDLVKGNSEKIYTGQELINMYKNHQSVPKVNTVISPYGEQYTYNALPNNLNISQASISISNTVVGIANSDVDNSVMTQYFDKLTSPTSDSLYKEANGKDSFVLGSYGSYTAQAYNDNTSSYQQLRGPSTCDATTSDMFTGNGGTLAVSIGNNYNPIISAQQYYSKEGVPIEFGWESPTYYNVNIDKNLVINFQDNTVDAATTPLTMSYINKSGKEVKKDYMLSDFTHSIGNQYYMPISKLPDFKSFIPDNTPYPVPICSIKAHFTTLKPKDTFGVTAGLISGTSIDDSSVFTSNGYNGPSLSTTLKVNGSLVNSTAATSTFAVAQGTATYVSVAKNQCSQTISNSNSKTDEFTITNNITNKAVGETQYYGIQRIPTNLSRTLGNEYNDKGVGSKTTSTLEGLVIPKGTEVYLIPDSQESKYNSQLNTKDIKGLDNLSSLMNSSSGLVKYTPGMNLSGYVGFVFKTPVVKQNESTSIGFRIKCSGMSPNLDNIMYTGFKYYDYSHSYGSVSQINKLNINSILQGLQYKDILNLSTNDGSLIPTGAKFTLTYKNGKTSVISANKATQVVNDKAIKSLVLIPDSIPGYTVVSHKEEQKENTMNTLITNTTDYIFHKIDNTIEYKAIDGSGNIVSGVSASVDNTSGSSVIKDLTNKKGTDEIGSQDVKSVTTNKDSIPSGYVENGNVTLTKTTDSDGDTHWIAVQKLTKLADTKVTTMMKTVNGVIIDNVKTYDGYNTENIKYKNLSVPSGYHLISVTDNGVKCTPTGEIIGTKNTQNLVWVVEENNSQVKITYMDGKNIIIPTKDSEVKTGDSLGLTIKAPKGYKVIGITYNNKTITKDGLSKIKANTLGNNVIVQLNKINNTVKYKAIDQDGTIVNGVSSTILSGKTKLSKNLTNKDGADNLGDVDVTSVTTNSNTIPYGYEADGTVTLTKTTESNGDINWVAVQKLTKLSTSTVVTQIWNKTTNKLSTPVSSNGLVSKEIKYSVPVIPKGTHLVGIVSEGKDFVPNKTDTVIGQPITRKIIWEVANNTHKYQVKFTSNIPNVSYGLTTNKWSGNYNAPNDNGLTTNIIPLDGSTETWEGATAPVGYKQVGKPKITTVTTGTYDKVTTTTYTYKFAPIPKVTVTNIVELTNGTVIPKLGDSVSGYSNSNVKLAEPKIPDGYHLVKKPTNTPLLFPNKNVKCVWVIAKNEVIVNTKYIDANTGKDITGGTFNIDGKVKNNAIIPGSPVNIDIKTDKIPSGYRKVGKITFTDSKNADKDKVITAVQKLEKIENKVDYKAVDQNGNIVKGVSATIDNSSIVLNKDITNKDGIITIGSSVVTSSVTNKNSIPVGYKLNGSATITETKDSQGNITYNILQHLVKLSPAVVTTMMKTTDGIVIDNVKTYNGYKTDSIEYKNLSIPKGYHLVSVTDNGNSYTPTGTIIGKKDVQNLVWTVEANKSPVKITYMDGKKIVIPTVDSDVKTGGPLGIIVKTPKGYKITGITYNNKPITIKELNNIKSNVSGNDVIVELHKIENSISYEAIDQEGNIVSGVSSKVKDNNSLLSKTLTHKDGSVDIGTSDVTNVITNTKTIPNGYVESGNVSLTKTVDNDGDVHWIAIQHLTKLLPSEITTKVINSEGKILVNEVDYKGFNTETIKYKIPKIPAGYKIVSITNNNKSFNPTGSVVGNKTTQNIVWKVEKISSDVSIVYKDGNKIVVPSKTTSISTGSPLDSVKLNVPNGYKISSVIVNGKIEPKNTISGSALSTPNTIVVNLVKVHEIVNVTATFGGRDISGVIIKTNKGDFTTDSSVVSKEMPYDSYSSSSVVSVPKGYKQDGKLEVNKTIDKDGNQIVNITVPLSKIGTGSVTTIVEDTKGNVIDGLKSYEGYIGSNDTALTPVIPKGYKIISITDNGKTCDGVPSLFNKGTQNIVWKVENIESTVTVKVVDKTTGKELGTPVKSDIATGDSLSNVKIPNIGDHYKIVSINVNGSNMKDNKITGNALSSPNEIIIKVVKNPTLTTVVSEQGSGKILIPSTTTIVPEGDNINKLIPLVPAGYHLVNIDVNGKDTKTINSIMGKSDENINIIVAPNVYTDSVTVETESGKVIVPTKTTTGVVGTSTGVTSNIVPKGYEVVSVTDNNVSSSMSDKAIENVQSGNTKVIIKVKEIQDTVTTKIIEQDGTVVVPEKSTVVNYGSGIRNLIPSVPSGYTPVRIVYNNKDIKSVDDIPSNVDTNTNITIIVKKIEHGTITTEVVDSTGKVIVNKESVTGLTGAKDSAIIPSIPKGYKVISITNNGRSVDGLPVDFTNGVQNMIWTVAKIQEPAHVTVKVIDKSNGKEIGAATTRVVKVGTTLGDNLIPVIQPGYKIDNITTDNVNTGSSVNGIAVEGNNSVIIYVSPVVVTEPLNVKIVDSSTGKTLVTEPQVSVNKGTPISGKFIPTIPKGYKINSVLVNGNNETDGLTGSVNSPTSIVVNVSPIQKGAITVKVITTTGELLGVEQEASGIQGSKDTLSTPVIPNGYKIVSITNNGVNTKGIPDTFTGKTQNIVYTVQKETTSLTNSIVTDTGVVIQKPETRNIENGSSISNYVPVCPKGYKITGITVNGKNYTSPDNVSGISNGSDIIIVEHVTKVIPSPAIKNSSNITVKVITTSGKQIGNISSYTGIVGSGDTASIPTIPAGYKIVSITNNGENSKGLPSKFTNENQNIVYTVAPIQKDTSVSITVENKSGDIIVPTSTVTGKPDSSTGLTLNVPSGYHLVSVTVNGEKGNVPTKFGNKNENVIVTVEKDSVPVNKHEQHNTPNSIKTTTTTQHQIPESKIINTKPTPVPVTKPIQVVSSDISQSPSHNPKTGDSSTVPFALAGILSALSLAVLNIKRKKPNTEKQD